MENFTKWNKAEIFKAKLKKWVPADWLLAMVAKMLLKEFLWYQNII